MQIIQNIRDKGAAIVIGVIALSLIGFIMMDAQQGGAQLFSGSQTKLGEVNGHKIDYREFQDKYKQAEDQYGGRISGAQVYSVRQSVWDQMVAEYILEDEFEKLGLTFTPKELSSVLFNEETAPYALKQAFTDKNTGRYDIEQARQWWTNVKKMKDDQRVAVDQQIIQPTKLQALYTKYGSLIAASAYYPTWMQQKDNNEAINFATFSYVNIPYTVISDSAVQVTDKDITDYISKRKLQFEQEAGRQIAYVAFSATPNGADTARAIDAVSSLKDQFKADTNAKVFVSRNMSAINFADEFVLRSKITATQKDSIAALPIGGVYGPYLEGKNFVVAKLLAVRQLPDSIKCRHILIATADPQTGEVKLADSIAKKRIDSIQAAIAGGANFAALAKQYSDDPGSKDKGGEYDFGMANFSTLAKEFAETVFYGSTGDKKVVKTQFGYHYIEVLNQKNFEPALKVAYLAKEIIASDETVNSASAQATKLSGEARNLKALDEYVKKNGLRKVELPNVIKENDHMLGGLQDAREVVKWAFEAKLGDVSEPMSIGDNFIVATVTSVIPKGLPDAKTARPLVEFQVRAQKKAEMIMQKLGKNPTLDAAAKAYNQQIQTGGADSSVVFAAQFINGVGQEPKVLGAIFNKANQGKVSAPIAGGSGVFVVQTNQIASKPSEPADVLAQRAVDKGRVMVQQSIYAWFEALKKLADITDLRSKFF